MQHSLSLKDPVQCYKGQSKLHCIMTHNTSLHTDILSMNVSWLLEDLELFENQFNILESMVFTIAICITFFMAIIVHRSFYRLMKRLPGRDINQIIYPYMVKCRKPKTLLVQETDISHQLLFQVSLSIYVGSNSIYTILDFWVYPLNDFVGDIGCYTLAYARNIGLGIIQVHSFYVVLFRYMCLFHLDLLQRFSISSKVSVKSMAFERDSLKNICVLLGLCQDYGNVKFLKSNINMDIYIYG